MPPKSGRSCGETAAKDAAGSPQSVTAKASLELPVSAVAGLQGEDAKRFEEYADTCQRACPCTHCWTPAGEVLIGCSTGELLKVTVSIIIPKRYLFYAVFAFSIQGCGRSCYVTVQVDGEVEVDGQILQHL